jgi:hypothetical protein
MLTRNIRVTKKVPVNVTSFRWSGGALVEGAVACNFKCCACGGKLGARRFGCAWDGDRDQSMRLCEDCGVKAEEQVAAVVSRSAEGGAR